MGALSRLLNVVGLVFLSHAVYSAYEHSLLTSSASTSSTATDPSLHALPLDITLETLVSLLILSAGIVLGAPSLRPIQWPEWASHVEKEDHLSLEDRRRLVERKVAGLDGGGAVGNPFGGLERRRGFIDIRAQRKEYANWVKSGGKIK